MNEQGLSQLEKFICDLEERLESDDGFHTSDEFQEKYDVVMNMKQLLSDQLDLPPDSASDIQLNRYEAYVDLLKKCEQRIRKIDNETGINEGQDETWMSDKD